MNNLRKLRNEKKMTIRELAERTTISYASLSLMENEKRPFTQENLEILCKFFDVSTDYMLGKSNVRKLVAPTPKEKLQGIQLAFYNQAGELSDEQAEDVLKYIEFLKSKER